jgi:hypothetical protein
MSMARSADALASTQDFEACRQSTLPYGNSVRTLQVDMIAFDSADEVAAAVQLFVFSGWCDQPQVRFSGRICKARGADC